ncbi:MAG TPA: sialidase family protein [Acidimicrobiia bacterium]|nr:sialidase family protein [Acidimicrobiia bacterium]
MIRQYSRFRRTLVMLGVIIVMSTLGAAAALADGPEVVVASGSPDSPFAQNKQNEPWVAIDPNNPMHMVAGANDEIDLEACAAGDPTTCPFTAGVGVTGVSFSLDGGSTWVQPDYKGYSARGCLGPDECSPVADGPIGTLPWFYEEGLVSDGDPSMVFGPQPGEDGFSWDNGSRLYFATLTSNFSAVRDETTFKGFEAIAVSRMDNIHAAASGDINAWLPPVVASKQSSAVFSDKEAIWADNAESSPYFGNVYVCNVAFRSAGGPPEPVVFLRSTDGGDTWSQRQISQASNTNQASGLAGGRQGCVVRSDSRGNVYVAWRGSFQGDDVIWLARSTDGGVKFARPRAVAVTGTVGAFDPVQGRLTFDGVAGARTNEGPTMDIANAAPSGSQATNMIVLGWTDGLAGLNNETAKVQTSIDGGVTWTAPFTASAEGDRPDFPWVAISPDGADVYVVYMAFLTDWQEDITSNARTMQGVVRHADVSDLSAWADLHRGATGDARGSSANSLATEFLGDYNYVFATNDGAMAVWNDVRNAASCDAVNDWRQSLVDGAPIDTPAPSIDCPTTFGNTDIFGRYLDDPTP